MRTPAEIGYWRNRRGDDVDLAIERQPEGAVIGMEAKAASRVTGNDWKGLHLLRDELGLRFTAGLVIHLGEVPYRLGERIHAVPIDRLWTGVPGAGPATPSVERELLWKTFHGWFSIPVT